MFQREVAKRLTASPGVKAYGALTVLVQYYAEATPVLNVSKKAFRPVPKVDSAVLKLDFNKPYPKRAASEAFFKKVVKGAFSHRRKTLLNSLKGYGASWGKEDLLAAMAECSIDPIRRAETLNMDEFLCLASALSLTNRIANARYQDQ
jgi:16S rRNA (adenine1518-N6/adenine1519-N6)-dimethyltransferase